MRPHALLAIFAVVAGCGSTAEPITPSTQAGSAGALPTATAGAEHTGGAPNGFAGGGTTSVAGSRSAEPASGSGGARDSTDGVAASGRTASGGTAGGGTAGGAAGLATAAIGGGAGSVSATPGVRVVGRSVPGANGSVRFSWPGVSLHARFSGTQVSMNLNDGNNKNRFTVVVDGGTPKTITASTQATLSLASGLQSGTHDLLIWRNTEPGMGISEFSGLTGFGSDGGLLTPPEAPTRRIEVIGDSLSVGAGVEGTSTSCTPSIDAFTNNYLAYGSVAARALQADVVTIAWSGIGVYRSYSANDQTMPQRYDYAAPTDSATWDFSKYQPQAVVINLGTNDFGAGDPGQPYVDAYVSFVGHVRSKYPGATVVLIDMYGGDRLSALNSVVTALKGAGLSAIQTLSFSSVPNNNTACNQHPNTAAQSAMGALLAARLKSSLGW